jgi:raffinose/stachyose/melibiose transport system permease protein
LSRRKLRPSLLLFLGPAIIVFVLFYFAPAFVGLVLSLTHWNGVTPPTYAGLSNYAALFKDPDLARSIILNIKVAIISLGTQLPLALLLAFLLTGMRRGSRIFQVLFFVPQMLSLVAVGILWILIYNPIFGPLAKLSIALGIPTINWFGSSNTALLSLMITTTWVYFGFHMLLQIAGITSIPQELFDCAKLETSSKFLVFIYVTIPLLRETLLISTIMIVSGSFSLLIGLFWIMTRGGPNRATELIAIYMYKTAFTAHQIGYASTIAVAMFIFMAAVVAVIVLRASRTRIEF